MSSARASLRLRYPDQRQPTSTRRRSEEHTSELQSQSNLVCRLLLEKKKRNNHKSAVRSAFQILLDHCARQVVRVLVPEYRGRRKVGKERNSNSGRDNQKTTVINCD